MKKEHQDQFASALAHKEAGRLETPKKLVISPVRGKRGNLRSLLARMRKSNRHSETEWGGPVGGEVW